MVSASTPVATWTHLQKKDHTGHNLHSTSSQQIAMNILENVLPVLKVAQAAVTGNPVPGLEAAITGVVALAEMVSTMKANMDDIPDLIERLKPLTEIDTAGCSDDLKQRLDMLKEKLKPHTNRLASLGKKSKHKQFFKSKKYEGEIQGIKVSIASHIQDFTFHNNISIEILVDQMSTKGMDSHFILIGWIQLSKEWNHKENYKALEVMENRAGTESP
ncbi:hypothetical protein K438DRAFT_1771628 [Mycena galopus ATCC 62051]|nr:hypothetical protein K438DRAFT_1771628 [Mycena galopus ATCC 62051]